MRISHKPNTVSKHLCKFLQSIKPLDIIVFYENDMSHVELAVDKLWLPGSPEFAAFGCEKRNTKGGCDCDYEFNPSMRDLTNSILQHIQIPSSNVGICRLVRNPVEKQIGETKMEHLTRTRLAWENVFKHAVNEFDGDSSHFNKSRCSEWVESVLAALCEHVPCYMPTQLFRSPPHLVPTRKKMYEGD